MKIFIDTVLHKAAECKCFLGCHFKPPHQSTYLHKAVTMNNGGGDHGAMWSVIQNDQLLSQTQRIHLYDSIYK